MKLPSIHALPYVISFYIESELALWFILTNIIPVSGLSPKEAWQLAFLYFKSTDLPGKKSSYLADEATLEKEKPWYLLTTWEESKVKAY